MYPPHEVLEKDGRRAYKRIEHGGTPRILPVWSVANCHQKLMDKQAEGKLKEFFVSLSQQMGFYRDSPDPMMKEWFNECFTNAEKAYNELLSTAVEDFGTDDVLEDFGV